MKRYAQLKTAGELPSPRGVAIAIIRLTQSNDVSLAEIGRVIKGDPAFVGRLIKAAKCRAMDGRGQERREKGCDDKAHGKDHGEGGDD